MFTPTALRVLGIKEARWNPCIQHGAEVIWVGIDEHPRMADAKAVAAARMTEVLKGLFSDQ